ncbi:MAG: SDR family NAD(P)-dependent oxidoreductase [Planctomycetota bacterium]
MTASDQAAPLRPPRRLRWRRNLAGAVALVTGASSGVGRAVALELARRGTRVLATARRGDRLAAVAAEAGEVMRYEAGDITSADFRRRLVATAVARFGGLDLVVAAAGSGAIGPFQTASADTLARIMAVDFFAPAELIRVALPSLARSPDPAIVLVGSILGHHPLPLYAEYCAAKAAVTSLAGTLRMELADDRIGVLLASLGPTESEFWDHLLAGRRPAWSRGRQLSAVRTAEIIVRGIEWRRRQVVPGWRAKGFVIAARLFPRLLDRGMIRLLRRSPSPP